MLKSACTAGTVRSLFRIWLVPKSCIFKLACAVAYDLASSLTRGWIILKLIESREGTSLLLCRQPSYTPLLFHKNTFSYRQFYCHR